MKAAVTRALVALALIASAEVARAQGLVIPVYRGVAPGSEGWTQREVA